MIIGSTAYLSLWVKERPLASICSTLETSASARVASGFGGVSVVCCEPKASSEKKIICHFVGGALERTNCAVGDRGEYGGADEAKEDEAADDGVVYSDLLVFGVPRRRGPLDVGEYAPYESGTQSEVVRGCEIAVSTGA